MESKTKIGIAVVAITSFAAFSIIFATYHHRRRKLRRLNGACYLHSDESKVQCTFKRVVADNSYSPFKHLKLNLSDNDDKMSNSHPYEAEITCLIEEPRHDVDLVDENNNIELSDSYVWVETEDKLQDLVDVLVKEKIFGVDTEQHSMRSFLGFTALIQISTRKEDYLVDTIALHDVMGVLRPVFADPKILKVFHGADNDVLWLQRDFHIYVVNLFDTAKACDVLSKPQKSLAYLLETYCGVNTNKLLQREDWRQRPLSLEMMQYARTDAHYLLYIANCLISELKEQSNACLADTSNLLLEASRRSNMTCLQLYTKDVEEYPGESAASSILYKHSNGQGNNPAKTSANKYQDLVRQLCAWRDIMARIHDENLRYVLSDQAIVALANKSPITQTEILSTISKADLLVESVGLNIVQSPSPVVCSHVEDLCYIFQDSVWNPDDIFNICLKHHLGPNGSCLLSILNYSLLSKSNMKPVNKLGPKQNGVRRSKQVSRKASRELFVQKFSCKSPVYHNCRIYANDGRLLCYCDRRKLEWYVRRDLAKLVDENPPAIMLLFEPKGRPEDEGNDFYVQTKKNICVGCGEKNHYLRYRIIPSCYRVHFPENLKSHRSHDIVLVCVDCHEVAHAAAERYKRQIAAELKIPLFVQKVQASSETSESTCNLEESGVSPLQLRTSAMALLRHGPTMPAKRREELTQILMKYFGRAEISEEDLETALLLGMSPHERRKLEKKKGMSFKHPNGSKLAEEVEGEDCEKQENGKTEDVEPLGNNDKYESQSSVNGNMDFSHSSKLSLLGHGPHGKQVVDHILKEFGEEGISQFCQKWRQVFVETVHPRFLAPGWDVMHSGRREFGEFSVFSSSTKASADAEV